MLVQVLSFQFSNVNKVFVVLQFWNCPQFLRECKFMVSFPKLGIRRSLHIKNPHVLKWGAGKMYVGDVRRLSKPFASLKICHVLTTGIHRLLSYPRQTACSAQSSLWSVSKYVQVKDLIFSNYLSRLSLFPLIHMTFST